jgi:hypothetical protein
MSVRDTYPDGACSDCGEPIPVDAGAGSECANCGHVFWEDTPSTADEARVKTPSPTAPLDAKDVVVTG